MATALTVLDQRLQAALEFKSIFKKFFASGTDIFKIVDSDSKTGMINLVNLKTGAASTVDPLSALYPNAVAAPVADALKNPNAVSPLQNLLSLGSTGSGLWSNFNQTKIAKNAAGGGFSGLAKNSHGEGGQGGLFGSSQSGNAQKAFEAAVHQQQSAYSNQQALLTEKPLASLSTTDIAEIKTQVLQHYQPQLDQIDANIKSNSDLIKSPNYLGIIDPRTGMPFSDHSGVVDYLNGENAALALQKQRLYSDVIGPKQTQEVESRNNQIETNNANLQGRLVIAGENVKAADANAFESDIQLNLARTQDQAAGNLTDIGQQAAAQNLKFGAVNYSSSSTVLGGVNELGTPIMPSLDTLAPWKQQFLQSTYQNMKSSGALSPDAALTEPQTYSRVTEEATKQYVQAISQPTAWQMRDQMQAAKQTVFDNSEPQTFKTVNAVPDNDPRVQQALADRLKDPNIVKNEITDPNARAFQNDYTKQYRSGLRSADIKFLAEAGAAGGAAYKFEDFTQDLARNWDNPKYSRFKGIVEVIGTGGGMFVAMDLMHRTLTSSPALMHQLNGILGSHLGSALGWLTHGTGAGLLIAATFAYGLLKGLLEPVPDPNTLAAETLNSETLPLVSNPGGVITAAGLAFALMGLHTAPNLPVGDRVWNNLSQTTIDSTLQKANGGAGVGGVTRPGLYGQLFVDQSNGQTHLIYVEPTVGQYDAKGNPMESIKMFTMDGKVNITAPGNVPFIPMLVTDSKGNVTRNPDAENALNCQQKLLMCQQAASSAAMSQECTVKASACNKQGTSQ